MGNRPIAVPLYTKGNQKTHIIWDTKPRHVQDSKISTRDEGPKMQRLA